MGSGNLLSMLYDWVNHVYFGYASAAITLIFSIIILVNVSGTIIRALLFCLTLGLLFAAFTYWDSPSAFDSWVTTLKNMFGNLKARF